MACFMVGIEGQPQGYRTLAHHYPHTGDCLHAAVADALQQEEERRTRHKLPPLADSPLVIRVQRVERG